MGTIGIAAGAVLLLAAAAVIEAKLRKREVAALERKLDRVLRRLGLDPETGELIE